MVEGTGPEALPEQRLAAAKSFLERQNQIAQEYVPTSKLEAGKLFTTQDRPYADITDRSLASQVPLFADIAPDVVSATSKLAGILEDCLRMGPPQAAPTGMPTPGFHPGGGATGGTSLPGAGEF